MDDLGFKNSLPDAGGRTPSVHELVNRHAKSNSSVQDVVSQRASGVLLRRSFKVGTPLSFPILLFTVLYGKTDTSHYDQEDCDGFSMGPPP